MTSDAEEVEESWQQVAKRRKKEKQEEVKIFPGGNVFFSEMFNSLGQVYDIQNAYAINSATISK